VRKKWEVLQRHLPMPIPMTNFQTMIQLCACMEVLSWEWFIHPTELCAWDSQL
jgi:hypothetical protein